jgi:hypothetical protein
MEQVLTGAVVVVRDANPAVLLGFQCMHTSFAPYRSFAGVVVSECRGQRLATPADSQRQARLTD